MRGGNVAAFRGDVCAVRLPPEAFYPCFGLAEATLIVSGGYVARPPVIRSFDAAALTHGKVLQDARPAPERRDLVGCGQTLPDQKIVIANPETKTMCAADEIGEIWVGGPSMAQGYWKRPDVTEAMFHAHLSDTGDGPFLRTGDLGFKLEGELFVTGRLKDLIILRGVNYLSARHRVDGLSLPSAAAGRLRRRLRGGKRRPRATGDRGRGRTAQAGPVRTKFSRPIRRAVAGEHDLNVDAIVLIRAGSVPKTSSGKIQRHACKQGYLDGTLDVVGTVARAKRTSRRRSKLRLRQHLATLARTGRRERPVGTNGQHPSARLAVAQPLQPAPSECRLTGRRTAAGITPRSVGEHVSRRRRPPEEESRARSSSKKSAALPRNAPTA